MLPHLRRGLALALLAILLAPSVPAQGIPPPEAPTSPLDPPTFPDLIPTNLDADVIDVTQPVRLCADSTNIGEAGAAVEYDVAISLDGTPYTYWQHVRTNATNGGNAHLCGNVTLTVPGWHTFQVLVDSSNQVPESNEDNNDASPLRFYVPSEPQVDLQVRLVVKPDVCKPRGVQSIVATVYNTGGKESPPTAVDIRDDNGLIIRLETGVPLPAKSSRQLAHVLACDYLPVGNFTAIAFVDPLDNVTESREDNNQHFDHYTVLDHPAPDLVLTDVHLVGNISARRAVQLNGTIANFGDRAVQQFLLQITDLREDGANVTVANITRSLLQPGRNTTFQIFLPLPQGSHVLRFVLDPHGDVPERNETNNRFELTFVLDEPRSGPLAANLYPRSLDAAPNDPKPGETVQLTLLVTNDGEAKSNASSVAFYADGELLGTKPLPEVRPGTSMPLVYSWGGSTEGEHVLSVVIDPDGKINEAEEGDNALDLPFVVLNATPTRSPTPTPTTPTSPTAPTPTTPTTLPQPPGNATPEGPRIAIGEIAIGTRQVPGGVKGNLIASLRNLNLQPLGALSVAFRVDGRLVKEVLVPGIVAAGTASARTGEIDLPEGEHRVTAEVRVLGTTDAPVTLERTYTAEAGAKGIPGVGIAWAVPALLGVALALRRRRPS